MDNETALIIFAQRVNNAVKMWNNGTLSATNAMGVIVDAEESYLRTTIGPRL